MLENWAKLSGFAAILASAMCVSFLWALNYVPPQNAEWTCEAKPDSYNPNKPALNTFSCHSKQSENLESQPARANKQSNQNAADSIKITDIFLALFNGLLVIVTAVLIAVGIGQGRELRNAVNASRAEFLATHRPRIRLKAIWLASADGQKYDPDLKVDQPFVVRLDIVNFGNTSAFITRINLSTILVRVDGQLPQRPPYNEDGARGLQFPTPFELIRGATFTQPVSDGHVLTTGELGAILHGGTILYFVGTVDYRDSGGGPMQTAFCRYLKFKTPVPSAQDRGRFETDNNPHYEYQD
jgi:hypothetical protein